LYLLRFFLYGLFFFAATSYWAFEPYPPPESAVKYALGFGALGGGVRSCFVRTKQDLVLHVMRSEQRLRRSKLGRDEKPGS
jgi:hypothetical protein